MGAVARAVQSLELSRRARTVLAVAMVVLAGSLLALAVMTENVTRHDGFASSDASHLRFFTDHRSTLLVDAAKQASAFGAAPVLLVMSVLAGALLWWRGARLVFALAPAVSLCGAAAIASVAKHVVGRARPPVALRLVTETEPSFPSGHATDSAAFYLALGLVIALVIARRPLARAVAVVAGGLATAAIGLSRLELGVHWPTDVMAGWALGVSAALVVVLAAAAFARVRAPAPEPSPITAPG